MSNLTFIWACCSVASLIYPVTQPPVAERGSKYENDDNKKQNEGNDKPEKHFTQFALKSYLPF